MCLIHSGEGPLQALVNGPVLSSWSFLLYFPWQQPVNYTRVPLGLEFQWVCSGEAYNLGHVF